MPPAQQHTTITFRPMVEGDLPLLSAWITDARVKTWFTDDDYISELQDHLNDPRVAQWIVSDDATPVAYLQDYDIHAFPQHYLADLPVGARGMDTFIAASDLMGRSLGPRYLGLHAARLFEQGVPALGIDPNPENTAAIRAYEKVGFQQKSQTTSPWGPVVLMHLWP